MRGTRLRYVAKNHMKLLSGQLGHMASRSLTYNWDAKTRRVMEQADVMQ